MREGERPFISGCRSQKKKNVSDWALCARIRNLVIILNAVGGNCRVLSTGAMENKLLKAQE